MIDGITHYWSDPSPCLSVLILTIPEREDMLTRLLATLDAQKRPGVEILINSDDRIKSVGQKRQECIDESDGAYTVFLDDDDGVTDDYIPSIVEATKYDNDCITFWQRAVIDGGNPFIVFASIRHNFDEPTRAIRGVYPDIRRGLWHWCSIKSEIARRHAFLDKSWGEDSEWLNRVRPDLKTETHIPQVLCTYEHSVAISRCSPLLDAMRRKDFR